MLVKPPLERLLPKVENRYTLAILVAKRARQLVDGAETVKIFGEKIAVKANVHTMGGFSAHAGQTDLLAWLAAIAPSKPRVVLTHGETEARLGLEAQVRQRFGLVPELPQLNDALEV